MKAVLILGLVALSVIGTESAPPEIQVYKSRVEPFSQVQDSALLLPGAPNNKGYGARQRISPPRNAVYGTKRWKGGASAVNQGQIARRRPLPQRSEIDKPYAGIMTPWWARSQFGSKSDFKSRSNRGKIDGRSGSSSWGKFHPRSGSNLFYNRGALEGRSGPISWYDRSELAGRVFNRGGLSGISGSSLSHVPVRGRGRSRGNYTNGSLFGK